MKTLELASDVVTGSSAFAAVIIVYIGSVATTFSSYTKPEQGSVKVRLRRRALMGCIGVGLAALAASCALLGKWASSKGLVGTSAVLMVITLAWGVGIAVEMWREIS